MIRHNRLLVTFHVVSDAMLGVAAFILAYAIRFQTDGDRTRGYGRYHNGWFVGLAMRSGGPGLD